MEDSCKVSNKSADLGADHSEELQSEDKPARRGDQFGLGKRVSTSTGQEIHKEITKEVFAQQPTLMGKFWGTLSYLTRLISSSSSASKVDNVAMNGPLANAQVLDPVDPMELSILQMDCRNLGISDTKIKKATENGTLTKTLALREKTLKHYNTVVENYDIQKEGRLALKSGAPSKLTVNLLQKVIKAALKNDISTEGAVIKKEGETFLIQSSMSEKLQITHQTGQLLGRGAFGAVYKVVNISTGSLMALKIAEAESFSDISASDANKALYREVKNLEIANAGRGHTIGVQPAAHAVYSVTGRNKAPGYLIPLYSQSLSKLARLSTPDIQKNIVYSKQLFSGLASVHAARLVHTDIKPDNIGVNDDEAYLADFGVAISTEQLVDRGLMGILKWALSVFEGPVFGDVGNPWYPTYDQVIYRDKIDERNEDEAREVFEKSDVCALGRCLFYMFSGGQYYDESKSDQFLSQRGVPQDVIKIIHSTQNREPLKRPSAQEVVSAFEKIQ